jgi:hypothetical protein
MSCHAEVTRPLLYPFTLVRNESRIFTIVKNRDVNDVVIDLRINVRAEIGSWYTIDPVVAMLIVMVSSIVGRKVVFDSEKH